MDHSETKPTTGIKSKQRYAADRQGNLTGKSSTKKGKSKANTLDDNDEDGLKNVKDDKLYYRRARKQPDPEGLPDDIDDSEMVNTFMTYFGLMNDSKSNKDLGDVSADDDDYDDDNDNDVNIEKGIQYDTNIDNHWRRRNDSADDGLQHTQESVNEDKSDIASSSHHSDHFNQLRHQEYQDDNDDHAQDNEDDDEHVADEDDDEDDDDDDMDDMDDMQEMERVRRKFDQQLQRMFGGTAMSEMNSQLRSILNTLKTQKDPTMQLVALQELAEILSVSNEETLAGYFACDSFAKELVRIMKGDDMTGGVEEFPPGMEMDEDMMLALAMSGGFGGSGNPEIMLLACRCLSNLMDAMPTSVTNVVYHGATKVLCEKLKSIEYIDLAEQALTALEKIASQLPRAVINEGGLSAVLMYFEFFSIHSQRTALRTAANCMRSIDKDTVPQVMEVLPTLMNTMTYFDRTVVELSCLCWLRITENYRPHQDIIEKLVSMDLLKSVINLIPVPGNANAARPSTFMDLLRILRAIVKSSPSLCCDLIKLNTIDIFYKVLTGSSDLPLDDDDSSTVDVGLDHKWRDSVYTILKIIIDSLPPLPKDGKFSYRRFKDADRYKSRDGSTKSVDNRQDPRTVLLQNDPTLLQHITILLVPLLMEMHTSMVNIRVRQLVTHILVKLVHFSDQAKLRQVLKGVPLSGFLASILTQQEHPILVTDTLYVAEMLIEKLPDIYLFLFQHEGVIHEIKSLSNMPLSDKDDAVTTDQSGDTNQLEDVSPTIKQSAKIDGHDSIDSPISKSKTVDTSKSAPSSSAATDPVDAKPETREITTSTTTESTNTPTNDTVSQQEDELRSMEEKLQSARRRLLNREDLPALLRGRIGLLQQQQQQRNYVETEKGIGHGSTRRCIIQLANAVINAYDEQVKTTIKPVSNDAAPHSDTKEDDGKKSNIDAIDETLTESGMETLQKLSQHIRDGINDLGVAKQALESLLAYCQGCDVGISSFELRASGLMEALLDFLTNETDIGDRGSMDDGSDATKCSLLDRQNLFQSIFLTTTLGSISSDGYEFVSMIILRLQELLARFEQYQVVTPLDVASSDGLRNPSSILSKQLRLRLTGIGANIPLDHQHLMVSTHAVATFRVIEDYLNSRIALLNGEGEGEDDDDDDDDDEDEYDDVDAAYQESTTSDGSNIRPQSETYTSNDIDDTLEQGDLIQQDDHVANIDQSSSDEQHDVEVSVTDDNDENTALRILEGAGTNSDQNKASTSASMSTATSETPSTSTTTTATARWCIRFSVKSTTIPSDSTIYGAVHRSEMELRKNDNSSSPIRNIWVSSYPINFERVWVNDDANDNNNDDISNNTPKQLSTSTTPPTSSPSDDSFSNEQVCNHVLRLLKVLYSLYNKNSTIHNMSDQHSLSSAFLSRKLTAKVNRQLEEPLIVASGCLPSWIFYLLREAPFLFPFETRYLFIQNTSYGYSRLISRWQSLQLRNQQHLGARGGTLDDTQQQQQLGRLERQKVRMMRSQILESAVKMLNLFATSSSSLEIEFVDEEGTGLGPTLEFYALTSKEFCKKSLGMWRDDDGTYGPPQQLQDIQVDNDGDDDSSAVRYVSAPHGLFPRPLLTNEDTSKVTDKETQRVLTLFKTLGRFVAKAMLDFRIIDIPFSVPFFNLVFGKNISQIDLVCQVDPLIAKSINLFERFLNEKRRIYADMSLNSQEKQAAVQTLQIDEISLDDLCLYFTLPGTDVNLKVDGDKIPVTIHNLSNYVDLLVDAIVGSGVSKQIEAFRSGFNDSFQIDDLKIITCEELVSLFGASDEDWSITTLTDTIKADHGFTMESPTLKNLLTILSEFDIKGRRDFLQFTTGSPRLPVGGWKSLRPAFTVVRKIAEAPLSADDYLPSVMTCANYLKMPDYSDKDTMLQRLQTAMDEGKDSFLLS